MVKLTDNKGKGVFATTSISKGQIIETSMAVELPDSDKETLDETIIWDYYFDTSPCEFGLKEKAYILLGYASLCNHSSVPNAAIVWSTGVLGVRGDLVSLKQIAAGEEISIWYTNVNEYVSKGLIPASDAVRSEEVR
ncbi:SET domain-containing protein-lysine N-methyltransferase [uncultured Ruegeria sp.]|uniref:SET domain-containing protein-lysine N-methyltransferase n=1 Tax=uncultured Ruegeria sp. TaxID=259304 RepID=UPI00263A0F3E|nr:SET domain-containing protein-lysine N-methyltransferase [uncultured Ruegeria sp.]